MAPNESSHSHNKLCW